MARAVGIFCNTYYFPVAVPILNSFFYNDVQARIKVYDHSGLNHLLRTYLNKFVDVVSLSRPSVRTDTWLHGCKFRPTMIAQVGFDDVELFLDTDMVALNNLEWPLHQIESGKFVCSVEWTWGPGKLEETTVDRWIKIVGVPPPRKFDVCNGGLLGFNFSKHYPLACKWARVCNDGPIYKRQPFVNDQMVISGILESLKIEKENLPRRYWMTTWQGHNTPPKLLGFNKQGKIGLYDSETGKPVQLYHYTGGIGAEVNGQLTTMRYYHARGESITERPELAQDQKIAWKNLWEGRYRSPVAILADYMRDAGPLTVPKVFSADFRAKIAALLLELQCGSLDKKVYAVCLAYDYLTLLDYRLGGECWLEKPLRALLGTEIYQGTRVLKWQAPADITLSFGEAKGSPWMGDVFTESEHLNGVNIQVN